MFEKSTRLFTLAKIPVKIHWSFALILLYIFWISKDLDLTLYQSGMVLLFFIILFLCVIAHEFGHALVARKFGVKTQDIILLPIGGIARLTRTSLKSIQEFAIAIAGPLVNAVVAGILLSCLLLFSEDGLFKQIENSKVFFSSPLDFLRLIIITNIVLFTFNLIPAYPMDGGRMLKSFLSIKFSKDKATKITAIIGQFLSVGLVIAGLLYNQIFIVLIGIFVFVTAIIEFRVTLFLEKINNISIVECINKDLSGSPISTKLIDCLKKHKTKDIIELVYDENDQLIGYVSLSRSKILSSELLDKKLGDIMQSTDFQISTSASLRKAYELLSSGAHKLLIVSNGEQIVGTISMENIKSSLK